MKNKQALNVVRTRKITHKPFSEDKPMLFDMPRGTAIKAVIITAEGYVQGGGGYADNAIPKLKKGGFLPNAVKKLKAEEDGGVVLKDVRIEPLIEQASRRKGSKHTQVYQVNAATLGRVNECSQGDLVLGKSGEKVSFLESIELAFENNNSTLWSVSLWDTNGKTESRLEIDCSNFANLLYNGGGTITGDVTISVDVITHPESVGTSPLNWRQTSKMISLTQAGQHNIEFGRGNLLQGFGLAIEEKATRDRIKLSDALKTTFTLMANGTDIIQEFNFAQLLCQNKNKRSNQELSDYGYVSLLHNKDFQTALKTANESSIELIVSLPDTLDFTVPVRLLIDTDEITPGK